MAFTAFVAFLRRLGWSFIYLFFPPFRVFAAFRGHWGGTLMAFTVLVVFTGHWGWTLVALFSVCSVSEGCRLVFLFYLFIYCLCGVACSVRSPSNGASISIIFLSQPFPE